MHMFRTATEGAAILAQRCDKARQHGESWTACCPAHEDRTPSLSIRPKGDRILLYCHAGCTLTAILAGLHATAEDLFCNEPPRRRRSAIQAPPLASAAPAQQAAPPHQPTGPPQITQSYLYVTAPQAPHFRVLRWEPGRHGADKSFSQERPHPTRPGHWIKNMQGVTRVLYHLPAVLQGVAAGTLIYLPEGEKDVETLSALGLLATTNAGGAAKWEPQYSEALRGAHVVILQDNDHSGTLHTARLTRELHGIAASIKVVAFPELPHKGDVSDWLAAGGSRAQLEALVAQTPLWEPSVAPASEPPQAPGIAAEVLPPRKPYVKPPLYPRLPAGALCVKSWEHAAPWLEAYCEHSRRWSPRGIAGAHQAVGLWVLSTIAARRVFCQVGSSQVYPVLFLAMVARSTLYAKSTTAAIGREVLQRAGCGFLLTADRTTPQALMKSMAGMVPPAYGNLPEDQQTAIRQRLAFAGQRGAYFEEWGGMLNQMRRTESPMAEFHTLLRVLDDNHMSYRNDTIQRGLETIQHPYLALMASATPHDLTPFMAPGAAWWHDGFWPRFAFITPQKDEQPSLAQRPRRGYKIPGSLLDPLHSWHMRLGMPQVTVEPMVDAKGKPPGLWHATVSSLPQQELGLSDAVYDAYEAYNTGLLTLLQQGEVPQDYDASYGRFHEKALRIALLLAAFAGDDLIGIHHWAYAQRVVEGWRRNLHVLVGRIAEDHPLTAEEQAEQKILGYVARVGHATAREIQRFLQRMTSAELIRLLDGMGKAGHLMKAQEGRKTVYALFPQEEDLRTTETHDEPPL